VSPFFRISLIKPTGRYFIGTYRFKFQPEPKLVSYRLNYTFGRLRQCIITVKVYGVFPSSHKESRIFTGNSNSLSQHWRQRGSRYAIHAGRNLPAKEFRYLRTVRVTAAVYQGLDLELAPLLLAFWHRAGLRPYTSSSDFAESCVFIKQSLPPILCHHSILRGPPHSEVTESFCRVPSMLLSHTP
jgi:hypothetical protein